MHQTSTKHYRKVVRAEPGTSSKPNRGDGLARTIVGAAVDSEAGTPLGRREDAFGATTTLCVSVRNGDNNNWNLGKA